ncbi:cell division protein FtsQ/DivIB [Streptomyces meridianus]|uniref:FtsQ-type POTRA domain-containing protein n=1 Tax=Streptomyces meridianus TaxID=2938945 RepID=A0ABT0X1M4_9ACTN|nr:FtsQ-type POTRA domain-containing protein [Streptomyces meridianus]MCM2576460.1 FtsQ-type POTRA domain-containing protein [Streptomyces meridianus]
MVATVLTGAGVWVLHASDWVRVENVRVSGTRVLTPREVRAAAEASGAAPGVPLAAVGPDAVAAALAAKLPRIESVQVGKRWPHTVELTIRERKPAVLIRKGGKYVEVDARGVRYALVDRAPRGIPLLESDTSSSPGRKRFGADRLRREAAGVASELPAELRRRTRVVAIGSYDSLALELSDGRTVDWGSSERTDVKATTLLALTKLEPGADHFDVSAPNAPAVSKS